MNNILKYFPCLLVAACASPEFEVIEVSPEDALPITIHSEINQVHTRRVEDGGFADGDAIGVYIVNYENGQPAPLSSSDNHATNVKFTFDEEAYSWNPERTVYWQDKVTPVDAYGYYPYRDEISDVRSMPFVICSNQAEIDKESGLGGYEASDFLWAKASGVSPTAGMIRLEHKHMMASVQVTLVPGEGFTAEEWEALDKTVMVENTRLVSYVNLSDGSVAVDEAIAPHSIVAAKDGEDWRAIVVPQVVEQGKSLISITINGYSFHLTRDDLMTYYQGKMHKFTIEVQNSLPTGDYQFKLIGDAVTVWECDMLSHSASVKEYVIVHVPEAGQLEKTIEALKINSANITNLKVSGFMTEKDFKFIRESFPLLEALNLKEVRLKDCEFSTFRHYVDEFNFYWDKYIGDDIIPESCCNGLQNLRTIVFPDRLTMIGPNAFSQTQLSGDLIIPEGVTHIGKNAFSSISPADYLPEELVSNHLTGKLVLPSSLIYIGESAFGSCDFHCDLILPAELEYIGVAAFKNCENMTGNILLPTTLKKLETASFSGMKKIAGAVVVPESLTVIPGQIFMNTGISSIVLPEGITVIERLAFYKSALRGELYLPDSITRIERDAFGSTSISALKLSENLLSIGDEAFANCTHLQGILDIPHKLTSVSSRCFRDCSKLEGFTLPPYIESIAADAFSGCYSLSYIRSEAINPPVLNSVIPGVAKDNFTVEVPEGSVDKYRSAPYWNEFKRISSYRGFVCRPSKANVLNAGGIREIILNADSQWTMVSCPDWCHMSEVTGNKKTVLTLTIDPMSHGQGNRTGRIEFKLNDSDEHYTHLTVGQYDYEYEEDECVSLQKSSKGNGINIFVVGDGYDAADISSGLYLEDMRQEMEYFFAVEPYKTYREYFDVHTAIALSNESGIGTLNTLRDVKFDTMYGDFDNERINGDAEAVVKYAMQMVDDITSDNIYCLTAVVIPNSDGYDGVTNMWTNGTAVAYCPKSSAEYPYDARGLIQHEVGGHAFGKLGDEYIYHQAFIQTCNCSCCDHIDGILDAQSRGWYRNLSLSGKYKDVEWSHLIYDPNYTDIVDIYEGGYFHSRGVYRSEYNSCMNDNVPYFSTISRQTIVERIMEYAGEDFSYDEFVANDSREWGVDFTDPTQTKSVAVPRSSVNTHRHQPIIIEGSPLD